jgi:hypothetical protein
MTEYDGFSKQDLLDRKDAINKEQFDLVMAFRKNQEEILVIDDLLEKMK